MSFFYPLCKSPLQTSVKLISTMATTTMAVICAVAVLFSAFDGVTSAKAAKYSKQRCNELKSKLQELAETEAVKNMAKGHEWVKANMKEDQLQPINQYITVDEQLRFKCRMSPNKLIHVKLKKPDPKKTKAIKTEAIKIMMPEKPKLILPPIILPVKKPIDDQNNETKNNEPENSDTKQPPKLKLQQPKKAEKLVKKAVITKPAPKKVKKPKKVKIQKPVKKTEKKSSSFLDYILGDNEPETKKPSASGKPVKKKAEKSKKPAKIKGPMPKHVNSGPFFLD